jgi:hypothetical protein
MVTKIAELEEKGQVHAEDSDDGDEEAVETTGLMFMGYEKDGWLIMTLEQAMLIKRRRKRKRNPRRRQKEAKSSRLILRELV